MEVITATELRKQLKDKLKLISLDKKTLVIKTSGKEDIVMMPRSEYNSWKESL